MAFRPRVAVQVIFSFVHFVAVGARKMYLPVYSVYMSLEIFRIPERGRAVIAFVPPPSFCVMCNFMMAAYLSATSYDVSKTSHVLT